MTIRIIYSPPGTCSCSLKSCALQRSNTTPVVLNDHIVIFSMFYPPSNSVAPTGKTQICRVWCCTVVPYMTTLKLPTIQKIHIICYNCNLYVIGIMIFERSGETCHRSANTCQRYLQRFTLVWSNKFPYFFKNSLNICVCVINMFKYPDIIIVSGNVRAFAN